MLTRILLAATSLALIGPPRIAVQTRNLDASTTAIIEARFHTDEADARIYGTAYGWSRGSRVEQTLPLERIDDQHYRVRPTWDTSRATVLVFGVEQGDHGEHGAAEALVRVARGGRVTAVDVAMTRPILGTPQPRRVNDREIEDALSKLGALTDD